MKSASLSVLDPMLLDSLRDQISGDFSARIYAAIPDVSDYLEVEAEARDDPLEKRRFACASQLLFSQRRELQLQIATRVNHHFEGALNNLNVGGRHSRHLAMASMALLTDDRLNEEIAINQCSRRLKEQCEFELWCLTRRIALLAGFDHPSDVQNPVFPRNFVQALMDAIDSLEASAAVRMAVFKGFGPALLDIVPAVYDAANASLAQRGIEIDGGEFYGPPVVSPEHHDAAGKTSSYDDSTALPVNRELASALTHILQRATSGTAISAGHAGASLAAKNVVPIHTRRDDETVARLREVLDDVGERTTSLPGGAKVAGRTLHDARLLLQETLTRDDQAIADIITVMFDRLSTDARMPAKLQPLVAKLQVPVLELALVDRSMLVDVDHPVRRLLDLIAEFGLTLGLGDDDVSTLSSVENIISGLAQVRDNMPAAFNNAFRRLDALFYHHEEAALQVDSDLRDLQHRESVAFAGAQADREIGVRLQNVVLTKPISCFIEGGLREILVRARVSGGAEGDQWRLALSVLDDIVKSVKPSTDPRERHRLGKFLPDMVTFLLNSFDDADGLNVLAANFFAELERVEELATQGRWSELGGERVEIGPDALMAPYEAASPSVELAAMGLACGDWIESRDALGIRRWRLNWITSIFGTCVFKHFESGSTRFIRCDELRERLASGTWQRVRGLGLADEAFSNAFQAVSRNLRRQSSETELPVPAAAGIAARSGASKGTSAFSVRSAAVSSAA